MGILLPRSVAEPRGFRAEVLPTRPAAFTFHSNNRARPIGWTYDLPAPPRRRVRCVRQRACRRGSGRIGPDAARRARDVRGVGRLLRPVAADAGGSGSRRRHAAERLALLRAREREARPPGRAAARRQGRFGAGRRRPAGAGALRRAHGVRRHAALSAAEHRRLPVVARLEHRSGRERGDELRRHAVHAARADRRARRARSRAARPRGLGAGRHVRSERHRPRARHRPLGMADAPRRGRADAGQDPPRAARRIALRGSAAHRQARHHRARAARAADAVLPRLVPPGSDGRDCRRRRRSRRRRGHDQGAFFVALLALARAAAARVRRAGPSRHALRRRHRQGNDRDRRPDQRPSAGAQPGIGRRLSRA